MIFSPPPARRSFRPVALGIILLAFSGSPAHAIYYLGNPAPRQRETPLRGLVGTGVENPFVVEGGRLSLEVLAFEFSHDENNSQNNGFLVERFRSLGLVLRVGIASGFEIQWRTPVPTLVQTWPDAQLTQWLGVGETSVAVKLGRPLEEGEDHPFSVSGLFTYQTPSLTPTSEASGQGVGVAIPMEVMLSSVYRLTMNPDIQFVNFNRDRWTPVVSLGVLYSGTLRSQVRFNLSSHAVINTDKPWDFNWTANIGMAWGINPNLVIWGGSRFALTLPTDDVTPYLGLSWRI